jgi:cell division protein FtsB
MTTIQVISAAVAFVSLLAAIIAGAWLNQRALERQIEAFRHEIKAEFAAVRAEIQAVNQRVASLESRVERIERQLDQIFKPVLPRTGD